MPSVDGDNVPSFDDDVNYAVTYVVLMNDRFLGMLPLEIMTMCTGLSCRIF